MLILTRTPGESIKVGTDVTVTVLSVNRRQVRLGIAAPKDIEIHREEVFRRIQAERREQVAEELKAID